MRLDEPVGRPDAALAFNAKDAQLAGAASNFNAATSDRRDLARNSQEIFMFGKCRVPDDEFGAIEITIGPGIRLVTGVDQPQNVGSRDN